VAKAALAFFAHGGFRYTLDPVAAAGDPVDGFVLGTREGFCEHYAAALAVMLRAARIPARVVAGYLGGEVNAVTGHITVRQSDAHAWVEAVLDPVYGWQRLDPTLAVAPERARHGLAEGVGAVAPRMESWGGTGCAPSGMRRTTPGAIGCSISRPSVSGGSLQRWGSGCRWWRRRSF
jgi:transglutaminase-like putative cysteine protease